VAFSVPPDVQQALAATAARAGKGLLLEKPIASSLDGARRLADEIGHAGVGSVVVFTARFSAAVRSFLASAADLDPFGGYIVNATAAFLEGPFSHSPWRHERGALFDIGPHAIDLLSAGLGDVIGTQARQARVWVQLDLEHASGAISTAMLSCHVPGAPRHEVELFGTRGSNRLGEMVDATTFATLRREFAAVVRGRSPHQCDVRRGLYVQSILDRVERQLRVG
jgi:predicted dehydrogenase